MRALLLAPLLAACGLAPFDDEPGGRDNLPTRAAGPYSKPEIDFATPGDEPYVLLDPTAHIRDPEPLARRGGGFRIWFTREVPDDGSAEIWYAELPSVHDLPDLAPERALRPDAEWEQQFVGEPSLIDMGEDHLVLYYRGGTEAIGRADSYDGGATWEKHAANPILEGATSPAAALLAAGPALYFLDPAAPGIHVATSEDGVAFTRQPDPVVAARPELADAFDRDTVGDPFALVSRTLADAEPIHVGLFFAGTRPGGQVGEILHAIGYAASYDGLSFTRFFGSEPILHPGPPSEGGPGVIPVAAGGVLFFHEPKQNRYRIGAAVHP